MAHRERITRVQLRNYRSIGGCDVRPGPLLFLVGPNGSGKSNFLDALRFVAESLRSTVDQAIRKRGGINQVRRRSTGHPTHFGVELEFELEGVVGRYAFNIGAQADGGFTIARERCQVGAHWFERKASDGATEARWSLAAPVPRVVEDRLLLVAASGTAEFRPVYDFLTRVEVYNLNPEVIREPQAPDAGEVLVRDGANAASALSRLASRDPETSKRVMEYLRTIVPDTVGAIRKPLGSRETIEFAQEVQGAKNPWRFDAANMSDGTLRALGVLLALFQGLKDQHVSLVGIEEPESALDPGAAGALRDAILEAGQHRQVFVTSHSPELLDSHDVPDESLISVVAEGGKTVLGTVNRAARETLKERLFTAGELLRRGQLSPDPEGAVTEPEQIDLFP
jgi:predicted ATPase